MLSSRRVLDGRLVDRNNVRVPLDPDGDEHHRGAADLEGGGAILAIDPRESH
jgi:hypothetical protein